MKSTVRLTVARGLSSSASASIARPSTKSAKVESRPPWTVPRWLAWRSSARRPRTSSWPPSCTWIGPMCSRKGPCSGNGTKPAGTSMGRGSLEDRVLAGESPQRRRVEQQRQQPLLDIDGQAPHVLEHIRARRLLARQATKLLAHARIVEHPDPAVIGAQRPQPRIRRARVKEGERHAVGGRSGELIDQEGAHLVALQLAAEERGQQPAGVQQLATCPELRGPQPPLLGLAALLAHEVDADRAPVAAQVVEEEARRVAVTDRVDE